MKAKPRPEGQFIIFFHINGTYSNFSLTLLFKAKKVTPVARNTKLQMGKLMGSEILSYHLVRCFNVPFVKIWIPDSKQEISIGQNVRQRQQNCKISKNL